MASMDMLIKEIYFEKQQEGSMLCAQHALNSLLQGEYFTPPDLAAIATKLDQLESGYDDANLGDTSTNMDDTGFFSIQVIEEALKPWSLSLRRWRSEVMLPYHDRPHCQLAFILNSQQHWYTLRRFGEAVPDFTQDPGVGHWFNLNSFNEHPMWVGKTYLSMTLQQAEEVGYSVFAVIQDDPAKPLALPRGEADYVAAFVTEDARPSTAYTTGGNQPSTSKVDKGLEDLDDEDAELQAALQASISGNAYTEPDSFAQPSFAAAASRAAHAPHTPRTPIQGARSVASLPPLRRPTLRDFEMIDDDDDDSEYPPVIPPRLEPEANLDPLEASRARSQAYMQQVMREQEAALRESRDAEALAIEAGFRTRRNRQQEQEDDELRRAIEASLASHEVGTSGSGAREMPIEVDEEIADEEEVEYLGSGSASRSEQRQPLAEITHGADRVYDDEDAELQAALRASLEGVPPGFTMPDTPPRATAPLPISLPFVDASTKTNVPPPTTVNDEDDHTETESEADTTFAEEEEREQVSMEEMRRRRLARFGG
ncbi:Josephin-domain-containing protein [Irpex rosettiformis]|uniref:Josephin-domain-containing protein n=1 Tax=Irpex rosettiformis TaxID=378272 RepID=A0ACB8UFQ9_9APHY|nr:Josephin-domain-containing protein [Irpex rosettiformis]